MLKMDNIDEETIQFLEGLSAQEIKKLIDTPVFRGTVLEAGARSEKVGAKINEMLDAEFAEMSAEDRARINVLARKLMLQHARAK